jgi:hypothetical protein
VPDRYGDEDETERTRREIARSDPYTIANCELCDDAGMRGLYVCEHIDYGEIAKRGISRIKAILEGGK